MNRFVTWTLDILYPRHCTACGKELRTCEEMLCTGCMEDLPLTYYWDWRENPAEKLLWGRTYMLFVASLFFYRHESPYSRILKQIKYHKGKELAVFMGRILGKYLKEAGLTEGTDYIVPVPLHRKKKRSRGYNQSEMIAEGISEACGIRISTGILVRERFTKTQTKISMGNKWDNVKGAFTVKDGQAYAGKSILLVDDVLTTGSTAEACYSALCAIPDIRISLATLAFVRSD